MSDRVLRFLVADDEPQSSRWIALAILREARAFFLPAFPGAAIIGSTVVGEGRALATVDTTNDPDEARRLLRVGSYDCAVLDYRWRRRRLGASLLRDCPRETVPVLTSTSRPVSMTNSAAYTPKSADAIAARVRQVMERPPARGRIAAVSGAWRRITMASCRLSTRPTATT